MRHPPFLLWARARGGLGVRDVGARGLRFSDSWNWFGGVPLGGPAPMAERSRLASRLCLERMTAGAYI
ncbi:hypothetical protein PSM7751_03186 [Pseudooceanicola marinus]|uniref:Uncharacterized protein n=1 Tax=Pseudooceanicola marinus TaxID=396013 RepID=A0A1X6ZV44_9RHOB|nr:hypothetical protein PSM7751_03186 [Pseudooceanicola marinus]